MEAYFELAFSEYDLRKGYDIHEIDRCIQQLRDHLEYVWYSHNESENENRVGNRDRDGDEDGVEDGDDDGEDEELMTEEEIDWICSECEQLMKEMVSGFDAIHTEKSDTLSEIHQSLKRIESYRGDGQQQTDEWFQQRKGMITASIALKILKIDLLSGKGIGVIRDKIRCGMSQLPQNSIQDISSYDNDSIVKELEITLDVQSHKIPANPDAANVRGNRYEPIIRRVYETLNGVTVDEYTCIPHPKYPFLGASPDGIVVKGDTLGRLVEIKCPFAHSVEKDGNTIRDEYWCQMQLQMEVCNLPSCDYVRAVIRDTATLNDMKTLMVAFKEEIQKTLTWNSSDGKVLACGTIWMGVDGKYYEASHNCFVNENTIHLKHKHNVAFIRHYVLFQKDLLVVNVKRNRDWFQHRFLPKATEVWQEIQRGQKDPDEWERNHPIRVRKDKQGQSSVSKECILFDE